MHTHSPLGALVAIIIVVADLTAGSTTTVAEPILEAEPGSTILLDGLSPELERSARWAIGLFDAADMRLPPVQVTSSADPAECHGTEGIHHPDGERSIIVICGEHVGFATDRVLLHELAHAWERHSVTPADRAAFQRLRGNEVWHDYDAAPWHENGTEQAAEIVLWGVIDRPAPMIRITQNSCDELRAAFRVLTGFDPLPSTHDRCGDAR